MMAQHINITFYIVFPFNLSAVWRHGFEMALSFILETRAGAQSNKPKCVVFLLSLSTNIRTFYIVLHYIKLTVYTDILFILL